MQFTREPTVESILCAKEGFKLSIKNSKNPATEPLLVESVQIVSFGGAIFYRHQDRPKAFLLPACDYEVVEVREMKLALKTPAVEKGVIKISGGKEKTAESRPAPTLHDPLEEIENIALAPVKNEQEPNADRSKGDSRRSRRSRRRRGDRNHNADVQAVSPEDSPKLALIPPPEIEEMTIFSQKDEIAVSDESDFGYNLLPSDEMEREPVPPLFFRSLETPPPLVKDLFPNYVEEAPFVPKAEEEDSEL